MIMMKEDMEEGASRLLATFVFFIWVAVSWAYALQFFIKLNREVLRTCMCTCHILHSCAGNARDSSPDSWELPPYLHVPAQFLVLSLCPLLSL